ncbi:hypothetical protein [Nocardioides sp.]|uniref:hypothetical protein n=1 Tax=Nocardioides sp. TaxID=35761 RepID=UPI0035273F49
MRAVHAVVPAGVDDPRRPSGGNSYDRQVLRGLAARGWEVHERSVTGPWPEADPAAQGRLAGVLDDIGDGAVVLVDGLVASLSDRALVAAARRLRVVPLVHLPVGPDPREGRVLDAAAVVVATSRHTREWLLEHYALEPHRVGSPRPARGRPRWGAAPWVAAPWVAGGCSRSGP